MKPLLARIGSSIAPPRFLLFLLVFVGSALLLLHGRDWTRALLLAFDLAAIAFLLSAVPLLRQHEAETIHRHAVQNDANRPTLLVITAATMTAILTAVAIELQGDPLSGADRLLILGSLVLAWLFSNSVYALHYAHLYYRRDKTSAEDASGLDFPGPEDPDYFDFLYFAFTLGMTFQTSDIGVRTREMRRVVALHCIAAFFFNLGVLAFTINVLGSH